MDTERLKDVISEEEIIGYITKLVSIRSHSGLEKQEKEIAEFIHETFKKEGIQSSLVHVQDERYNVIAKLKGNGKGKSLLLTGHTDTVPPFDMENPFEVKRVGDKLKGRGVLDMKGPLACMIFSLIALKRANIELMGDVVFAGVIDEEETSLGTIDLIEKGINVDAAIVGEPSNLDICVCHRGLESFEFHFEGKAVHSGKQGEGINAIAKAAKFIQRLEEVHVPKIRKQTHPILGHSTLNYGTITGGTQPCTVADKCILKLDTRWVPGVKYDDILKEFQDIIDELKEEDEDFRCTFKVIDGGVMKEGYVHEAMETDTEHPLIDIVSDTTRTLYAKTPVISCFTAWSDGGLLSSYGKIPTIVFGPGDLETAHSDDEELRVDQIFVSTLIYTMIAINFCK